MPWKHVSLAVYVGQLSLSLFLRFAAHREPRGTWQRWSPPEQGGGVWCRGTHSSVGALPSREAGSGAAGHVAVPEPSRAGRQDLQPWDMWQRRSPLE
jgi:hypothetical protein